jgi:UDP:flavonoid glycosyltransferase YjiC (YdhE family)
LHRSGGALPRKVLFVLPPMASHVNIALGVAQRMRDVFEHRIVFVSAFDRTRSLIEEHGFQFR